MSRVLLQLGYRSVLAALVWFGFFGDVEGARNVARFVIWFFAIGWMLSVQSKSKIPAALPPALTVPYDVLMVSALVWTGAWVTALAYSLGALICHGHRIEAAKVPA